MALAVPRARARRLGRAGASASCCACGSRPTTGSSGSARPRRSSPTTASRSPLVRAALDAYAEVLADCAESRGARGLPRRARPAPGARRRRPRAVGPRRPALRPPGGAADLDRGGALDPRQRDDRRRGPRRRARRAAAAAAQADFDTVKVKVGIGDDAGRLAAVRAAVGPRVAIRVDANGAWDVDEAVAALQLARARRDRAGRGAGPRRRGAARGARRGRRAAGDGRDGGRGGRRGLGRDRRRVPEDRALRRHHRRPARRRARRASPAPPSTSPRPSTARSGSPPPSTPPPGLTAGGPLPAHGLATLDLFAEPRRAPARRPRRDPRALRAGPGVRVTARPGITTWYLEMTAAAQLRPARPVDGLRGGADRAAGPGAERAHVRRGRRPVAVDRPPRLGRASAGARTSRATDVETWLGRLDGEPAGYAELVREGDEVEIASFGLLPGFPGRGLGGALLAAVTGDAWERGARRVWLHTCSLDSAAALPSYERRGFRRYRRGDRLSPRWVVDASNVIGSRPDGWWRDRAGAARRLVAALDDLAERTRRRGDRRARRRRAAAGRARRGAGRPPPRPRRRRRRDRRAARGARRRGHAGRHVRRRARAAASARSAPRSRAPAASGSGSTRARRTARRGARRSAGSRSAGTSRWRRGRRGRCRGRRARRRGRARRRCRRP